MNRTLLRCFSRAGGHKRSKTMLQPLKHFLAFHATLFSCRIYYLDGHYSSYDDLIFTIEKWPSSHKSHCSMLLVPWQSHTKRTEYLNFKLRFREINTSASFNAFWCEVSSSSGRKYKRKLNFLAILFFIELQPCFSSSRLFRSFTAHFFFFISYDLKILGLSTTLKIFNQKYLAKSSSLPSPN